MWKITITTKNLTDEAYRYLIAALDNDIRELTWEMLEKKLITTNTIIKIEK